MTQYLSDKLKVLSFISIMLVLYIHSDFKEQDILGMFWNNKIQVIISEMIGRCAVPLFYIISGFLFFLNVPNGLNSIYKKMKKRVKTLLVPYVVGCLFFVVFSFLVAIVPGTSKFINNSILPLFHESYLKILTSIFYDAGTGVPCAFQLWFLRDLILIVSTAPIWYIGLKKMKWFLVIIIGTLTFLPISYLPLYALFWFLLGGQLTFHVNKLYDFKLGKICMGLFIIVSFLQLLYPDSLDWNLLRIPSIILGIAGFWFLYDKIAGKNYVLKEYRWLSLSCQYTFFIYLFHEPTLNIIRKLIVFILGHNAFGYFLSYLISPIIFAIVAIYIGVVFKTYIKNVYFLCTGGR